MFVIYFSQIRVTVENKKKKKNELIMNTSNLLEKFLVCLILICPSI